MEVIYTIDQFKEDVDLDNVWYLQALRGEWADNKIDYWNFNCCLHLGMRPAIVTRDELEAEEQFRDWDKAYTYKGFIFWIPRN